MPRYWVIAPVDSKPPELFDKVWQFDLANNRISILAGAHLKCGCGFPADSSEYVHNEKPAEAVDVASMRAVAAYIGKACSRDATVRPYLCWAHELEDDPVGKRSVSLAELRNAMFRFRHKELLTVGR